MHLSVDPRANGCLLLQYLRNVTFASVVTLSVAKGLFFGVTESSNNEILRLKSSNVHRTSVCISNVRLQL